MTGRRTTRARVGLALAAGLCWSLPAVGAGALRAEIEAMARDGGFSVEGVEHLRGEAAPPAASGDAVRRIGILLADYNFVLVRDAEGRIARLAIVGLRQPPPARPDPAPTTAEAVLAGHYVDASIRGPNGRRLDLRVMVDTGASTMVLPRSLAAPLGFPADDLKPVRVQTANGETDGGMAVLPSVRVGDAEGADVAVTFVEDRLLAGRGLLGMSFLGRFRMTIDGKAGNVRLEPRQD